MHIPWNQRHRPRRVLALVVAATCGALLSVALPPSGIWPMAAALVPLFALVAGSEGPRAAFELGVAFATPFFALYIWWLPASLAVGFGPAAWLILPPLVAALALVWGLLTGAARLLGGRGPGTLLVLPGLWVLIEWARTQGYFGFPWGTLGYAWLDTPVAQLASIVGVYGLGLLTTSIAALLAAPFVGGSRRGVRPGAARVAAPVLALLLLAGAWGWGTLELRRTPPEAPFSALLVQGPAELEGRRSRQPRDGPYRGLVADGRDGQRLRDRGRRAGGGGWHGYGTHAL